MTTPLLHAQTFRAWLDADSALHGRGHSAAAVSPTQPLQEPYWVFFGGGPDELDDHRQSKRQDPLSDAVYEYTVRSVAADADGALAVASKVFVRAVGAQLELAGRSLDPVELVTGGRVKYDPGFPFPVFFVDDLYRLTSRRG